MSTILAKITNIILYKIQNPWQIRYVIHYIIQIIVKIPI